MCAWSFIANGETATSSFPKGSFKRDSDWLVATETVSLNSLATDQSTSVIDFLPYGVDFVIEVDPSATLTTNAPVDIDYCYTRDGTFTELCTTGATVLKAGTASRNTIDVSAKGTSIPAYLKLRFDKAGVLDDGETKTVVTKIIVHNT